MRTILLLIVIVFVSCNSTETKKTAQQVIDDSIISSGLDKVANSKIEFEFRNRKYLASRNNGTFALERFTTKDSVTIHDILSNNDFERYRNDVKVQVPDSMRTRYSSSVNSVHYFSVLPYGLNDLAVKKKLLDDVIIKEKEYYKVQVSFSQDGGGEDFEDVFVYWINKKTNFVDYLAYSFHVNGGGMRFREVYNEHIVNGIRLVDYNNYKPKNASTKLLDLDKAFENNGLEKLSEINLKNIKVELLDNN